MLTKMDGITVGRCYAMNTQVNNSRVKSNEILLSTVELQI